MILAPVKKGGGAGGGSGDITSIGDVASGAAFDGTQGTVLTFFNAGGNATADYDGVDFTFSKPINATNLSGTNTGDQTITLTGDVTGSGTGSFATTYAGVVPLTKGGTGQTTKAAAFDALSPLIAGSQLLSHNGVNNVAISAVFPLANRVLQVTTSSNFPAWALLDLTTHVTNTLPVANGGTGGTTAGEAQTNLAVPPNTRTITSGNGLTGGGNLSADRTLAVGAGTGITVGADDVALTVPVVIANGGTNSTTALNNQRVMTSVGGAIVESGAITDGESIQRNNTTFISAPLPLGICEGRLTLTSGTPVTTTDVTAATTIYFAPYKGDRVYLYDGTRWRLYSFTEISLALGTLTSGLPYDVFLYDNAGTLTLESLAWTNGTTRATNLITQNGVLCKTGALTRRYLGTFYTTATTTTEDSAAKRFLWNYYNRVERFLYAKETTDSWTYTTAAWRETNGGSTPGISRVDYVVGFNEDIVTARAVGKLTNSAGMISGSTGIGIDTSTASNAMNMGNGILASIALTFFAEYIGYPGLGYHSIRWLEYSQAIGTTTWYGDAGIPTWWQAGMVVTIKG